MSAHTFGRRWSVFEVIAICAALLVLLRMRYPQLVFDNQSLSLIGLAALALALPKLLTLLPPLVRFKAGPVEAEFDQAIQKLEQRVKRAEDAPEPPKKIPPRVRQATATSDAVPATLPSANYSPLRRTYVKGFKDILSSRTSNTEKILAAAILVESMLSETAQELELESPDRSKGPSATVRLLASEGFITAAERDAFLNFWKLRNDVVHGRSGPPTDEQTARMLDLLWRLIRILG